MVAHLDALCSASNLFFANTHHCGISTMSSTTPSEPDPGPELSDWEAATIEVFVRAANLIGLPRSVGEIYGVLYCAERPLAFDDLVERLGISRGSVSQGLKVLRQLGAVRLHYIPGSRRDHYVPELSMKRLASGFMRDQIDPHLESGVARLAQVEELIAGEPDPERRKLALQRLSTLRNWQSRTRQLVPIIMAVLSGVRFFSDSETDLREEVV